MSIHTVLRVNSLSDLDSYLFGKGGDSITRINAHGRKFKLDGTTTDTPEGVLELCRNQVTAVKVSLPKATITVDITTTRTKVLSPKDLADVFQASVEYSGYLASVLETDADNAENNAANAALNAAK